MISGVVIGLAIVGITLGIADRIQKFMDKRWLERKQR